MDLRRYGRLAKNLSQTVRGSRFVPPGHFYSPVPSQDDVRRALASVSEPGPELDLRVDEQLALAAELAPHAARVDAGTRFRPGNDQFSWSDAAVLRSMLTRLRPRVLVEVGSGHSSAQALDTADVEGLETTFTFIDPYPERLESVLTVADRDRVTIERKPVQDVPLTVFDQLGAGDVLFIDSSHVAKAGSDVGHLLFSVLPRLVPGVWVHVHDVFWPFEYPEAWLTMGRAWNEDYLLRAFLTYNSAFRVELFSDYLVRRHPDAFAPFTNPAWPSGAGSIWLSRQ